MQARDWLDVFAVVFLAGCATAPPSLPTATTPIPNEQFAAETPSGLAGFCVRFPDQCAVTPNGSQTVALNDQAWRLIYSINQTVNHDIWPQSDNKHYGRFEYWTIPTDGYGDCTDYALTKRKDLIAAGFPSQALRLAIVDTPRVGRHAVLTVVTNQGDYVLDNLTDDIRAWLATGYTWLERQDGAEPMKWISLLSVNAELGVAQLPGVAPQLADPVAPTGEIAAAGEVGQQSQVTK